MRVTRLSKAQQHEAQKIIQSISAFFNVSCNLYIDDVSRFLNDRQIKIIKMKIKGYRNVEIAKTLDVCPATITIELYKIRKILIDEGYKDLLGE